MRKELVISIGLLISLGLTGCGDDDHDSSAPPAATATAVATRTRTSTIAPTHTHSAVPSSTVTPTHTLHPSFTTTVTATASSTHTSIPTPTATASETATNAPSATPSGTATPSESPSVTSTATQSPTVTATGVPLPEVAITTPAQGAAHLLRTAWIHLEFSENVVDGSFTAFALQCDGVPHGVTVGRTSEASLVVNPTGELPAGAACSLSWPVLGGGSNTLSFSTAPAGAPVSVVYDRTNTRLTTPFPDDFWLVSDATTASGSKLAIRQPTGPNDVQVIFRSLLLNTNKLDGFSPLAHITIELSDAPDVTSLPRTAAESLDPLASVALFNVTPGSPDFGRRIPFEIRPRSDANLRNVVAHSLILFPSIPLEQHNRYGLVITNRVFADNTRPFAPSSFFAAAKDSLIEGESAAVSQVRSLANEVIAVAEAASPPIPRDDIALAVRVSIRTTDDIPTTLRSVKEQVLAADPPAFTITNVRADSVPDSDVAAIVEGEWQAPDWREFGYFKRDANGLPVRTKTNTVPFILALPKAALSGPAPITMYQHGNPGSAQAEVPGSARRYLADAGFAVIGFTDILNRELSDGLTGDAAIAQQVGNIFLNLLQYRRVLDAWLETNAEQIAFLRMIEGLGTLDVLPIGAPDGVPDLDPSAALTYVGISQGANHAPGLLPFAPELRASALVVGGARIGEVLIHQQAEAFIDQFGQLYPNLTAADIWVGIALFQGLADNQDVHNYVRFIYRDPFPVRGTMQRSSILVVEGIDDSLVPNNATNSLAWALGPIPHLRPVQRAVPYLTPIHGPVTANIDAYTTAAFFQYTPVGVAGISPSPGCAVLSSSSAMEGHYCAQSAAESLQQRVAFFQSALSDDRAPTIINPYASNLGRRVAGRHSNPDRDLGEEAY